MIKTCPNCGCSIVHCYNIDYDSYYLRCKNNYECWHKGCDKHLALQYPKLTTSKETLLENIKESIENGDDYYNGYCF